VSKAPSDVTLLRTIRAEYKRLHTEFSQLQRVCNSYRSRATKAEQEAAEWKVRFDILLRREDVK
jgi:hypothetical protein